MIDLTKQKAEIKHQESRKIANVALIDFAVMHEIIDRAIAAEAKLAEIEKQEPIYMWQLDDEDGWIECTKAWFYGHMSNGYEKRIVYASTEQQSPAVGNEW